jgi:mannose-6-phosphate isomerase-like protein (cupin superfamily)
VAEEPTDTVQLIGAKVTFVPMEDGMSYELSEWVVEPGIHGPPIHIHHQHDEGFYVMSGHFGFILDGVTTYSKPGTHVMIPMGHEHSFWNAGARPGRLLLIASPPGMEPYFRALAAQLGDVETQEGSIELRQKLGEKYDIEVVGPPAGGQAPGSS